MINPIVNQETLEDIHRTFQDLRCKYPDIFFVLVAAPKIINQPIEFNTIHNLASNHMLKDVAIQLIRMSDL